MKLINTLALCLMTSVAANAADSLVLTFSRTGTSASDVSVTVDGIDGVTAEMTSVSHDLKELGNSGILCANVNGNTSPTITMSFAIMGLTSDFTFNDVGLNLWALNASGGTQTTNDNQNRQFNISVSANDAEITSYTDLDPAAGVDGANKYWHLTTTSDVAGTSPLNLTLTITAGTANVGCFLGVETITLNNVADGETAVDPEPETPETTLAAGIYTIKWKNNTTSYMSESTNNAMVVTSYATTSKIFWELIPTGNENCYYVRNTATGNYIGSCNKTASASSTITTTETPVEYYIGYSTSTSGDNVGCYWMTSTDCSVYNTESSNTLALNKDGASSNIITWTAATSNVGSYWTITASEDLFELKPFNSSDAIGTIATEYYIVNSEGRVYSPEGQWEEMDPLTRGQRWYFVGTSNKDGGYQIVSVIGNTPLNDGACYKVEGTNGDAPYSFVDSEGNKVFSDVTFLTGRSSFALASQIYQMPCGSVGDVWIAQAIVGDIYYPTARKVGKRIVYDKVTSQPSDKYTIYSRESATVNPGSTCDVAITLSSEPSEDYKMVLCLDWNRDGYFEYTEEIECAKSMTATINVPADAQLGKVRVRFRLTDNGLLEPDADVNGNILDMMLNVVEGSDEVVDPVISVNDPNRGTAVWENGIATATRLGNASFLYWYENRHIISVTSEYEIAASTTPREITAFFSVNTQSLDGIDEVLLSTIDNSASINFDGNTISVENANEVKVIVLFAVNGSQAAAKNGNDLSVAGVASGVYIVKAVTDNGVASSKIKI